MQMIPAAGAMVVGLALSAAQQSQPAPPALTVLRIASGPHGEVRNGDFVLDEERTQFDPSKDKQVLVFFQWQGQPGVHRMTAQWKSPDGASSTTSPVQYEARDRRFGAFWPLMLSPASAAGTWSIEATVDGQPGGRFERATAKGGRLDPAAAFAAGRGRLFTAVAAVDGADTITAVLPDGRRQAITAMVAMNRQQDWIVLAGV